MSYIQRETEEVVQYHELQGIYPNRGINPDGTITIFEHSFIFGSPKPSYDEDTQKVVEVTAELVEGKYYQAYEVVELAQEEIEVIYQATVPQVISMRQARLALLQMNLLDTVDNAIANGTDEIMKIEWEYSQELKRDWDSLNTMTTALGMSSTDVDGLFMLGLTL